MVKYVYYDPATMQVEAEFDTPILSDQANWAAKGLTRTVVPDRVIASRDHKIVLTPAGDVVASIPSVNPVQPGPTLEFPPQEEPADGN